VFRSLHARIEPGPQMRRVTGKKTVRLVAGLLALFLVLGGVLFAAGSYRNYIRPDGIIIHHSAIPLSMGGNQSVASIIDEFHRSRGFGAFYLGRYYHIGYHYLILPDGTVVQGRPEHCRGAHADGYNSYVGICLIGNFSSKDQAFLNEGPRQVTDAQLKALTNLCRQLQEKYGIPLDKIHGHHDVNPNTECPGDKFPVEQLMNALKVSSMN
jgi:N-acetylmuramoyl-L-alanine amidase